VLSTNQKGAIAETAIIHAATKLGIDVYKPVIEGGRCDLVFDLDDRLVRVQCKWASRQGDVVIVRCYSSRRAAEGFRKRTYTVEEVDFVAAYCAAVGRCYLVPAVLFSGAHPNRSSSDGHEEQPASWRQLGRGVRLRRYTVELLGAIAQLGERLHGMQEVAGSSPAGSITDGATEPRAESHQPTVP
jgi:hypothetical protein